MKTIPKPVEQAVKLLTHYADEKLLRARALADRVGISYSHMTHYAVHPALNPFRIRNRTGAVFYANPKTIKIAKQRFGL